MTPNALPFHHTDLTQAEEMCKFTGIDIRVIEQELEFEKDSLLMSSKTPVYWSRLGSSKSRTAEQQELGKEMVLGLMIEAQEGTTYSYMYRNMSIIIILPLFLEGFPFKFFKGANHTPSFTAII